MVDFGEKFNRKDVLEQELRAALRPLPAPQGFANRVVARSLESPVHRMPPPTVRRTGLPPILRWSIAAALLLAIALGGVLEYQRQRQIAGERARQQVLLALRITAFTLQTVRNRVDKNNTN